MKTVAIVSLVLFFCVIPASSQVIVPEQTVKGASKQNGWHLNSVLILFDGTQVKGLNTVPKIRVQFERTYTDANGVTTVIPEGAVIMERAGLSVKGIGKGWIKTATGDTIRLTDIFYDLAWRQGRVELGLSDTSYVLNKPALVKF